MRTYYDIFDVDVKSSQEEIQEAYQKVLAKLQNNRDKSIDEYIRIQKYYKTLSDPNKRHEYDLWIIKNKRIEYKNLLSEFIERWCKSRELKYELEKIINSDHEIYLLLNTAPSEDVVAKAIKTCLLEIQQNKSQYYLQTIELESICNNIIVDKLNKNKTFKTKNVSYTIQRIKEAITNPTLRDSFPIVLLFLFLTWAAYKYISATDFNSNIKYEEVIYTTGDIPYETNFGSGKYDNSSLSSLTIKNKSENDAVVLLTTINGEIIRNNYIKSGSSYRMSMIPNNQCLIKVMFGKTWNPLKDNGSNFPKGGFMKDVSYMKSNYLDLFDFTPTETLNGVEYPTYSITLHKVRNGNMKTTKTNKEGFFN